MITESWTSQPRTSPTALRFVVIYRRRHPEGHGRRGSTLGCREISAWAEHPDSRTGRRRSGEYLILSALGFFARAMSPWWQPHNGGSDEGNRCGAAAHGY